MKKTLIGLFVLISSPLLAQTYAERLGWDAEDKVIIMHVDDAGMSYDSNQGTIRALGGLANSVSVMMPCPWATSFIRYAKENPEVDAGLHLTLTSEWKDYRWEPLTGQVPGLIDSEGAMWHRVEQVANKATADEVEAEIRAQVERALAMNYQPTHLDSHMGTLFATEDFLERYINVGAEYGIPVMLPGGHNSFLRQQYQNEAIKSLKKAGKYKEGMDVPIPDVLERAEAVGKMVWDAGLPVLDDLHNTSGGWRVPEGQERTPENITEVKVQEFLKAFEQLQPGITMFIVHCTDPTEVFPHISGSGLSREGDMLALLDPRLERYIKEHDIKMTTWRELKQRRDRVTAKQ